MTVAEWQHLQRCAGKASYEDAVVPITKIQQGLLRYQQMERVQMERMAELSARQAMPVPRNGSEALLGNPGSDSTSNSARTGEKVREMRRAEDDPV